VPTIEHHLSAIASAHQLAGGNAPTQHADVRTKRRLLFGAS
jgi:hypothetical protein